MPFSMHFLCQKKQVQRKKNLILMQVSLLAKNIQGGTGEVRYVVHYFHISFLRNQGEIMEYISSQKSQYLKSNQFVFVGAAAHLYIGIYGTLQLHTRFFWSKKRRLRSATKVSCGSQERNPCSVCFLTTINVAFCLTTCACNLCNNNN